MKFTKRDLAELRKRDFSFRSRFMMARADERDLFASKKDGITELEKAVRESKLRALRPRKS